MPTLLYGLNHPAPRHSPQYFNYPASASAGDPSSPISILKRIAQPADFVVFKLDIDNGDVEGKILEQLLQDEDALKLVDEFFFEYHVCFDPMLGHWIGTFNPNKTLSDSYALFYSLRKKGLRAHSWV